MSSLFWYDKGWSKVIFSLKLGCQEYHPTTLLHPDVACLFRLHSEQEFAALTASASLPVTEDQKAFSKPSQSRKAVLAALQLLSAEIVIGLLFLHQMGIIHQDIKPSNILISKTGHVVIGDFGAATRLPLVSRDTVNSGEPIFGAVVLDPDDIVTFTPLYAAPELLERDTTGLLIYNERVDWWSLGVLLYELVTGTVPFRFYLNGTRCVNEGRRSDGDRSLSFGPLEKLGVCHDDESDEAKALDQFLRAVSSSILKINPETECVSYYFEIRGFVCLENQLKPTLFSNLWLTSGKR